VNEDDQVMRMIDRAMAAQQRLVLNYLHGMRENIRQEIKLEIAADFRKKTFERNEMRNELIRQDGARGLSIREIGRKHNIGKTQVAVILNDKS